MCPGRIRVLEIIFRDRGLVLHSWSQLTGSVIRYRVGAAWEARRGTLGVSMSKRFVFDEKIPRIVFCPHIGEMEHTGGEIRAA